MYPKSFFWLSETLEELKNTVYSQADLSSRKGQATCSWHLVKLRGVGGRFYLWKIKQVMTKEKAPLHLSQFDQMSGYPQDAIHC